MRHVRVDIARLSLDGADHPLAYGDVLVVDRDNAAELDWECVVMLLADTALDQAPHRVHLCLLGGQEVTGDAILVRSTGRLHVLRGAGPLNGADHLSFA